MQLGACRQSKDATDADVKHRLFRLGSNRAKRRQIRITLVCGTSRTELSVTLSADHKKLTATNVQGEAGQYVRVAS
ncbi:hypothetical protein [Actinomadura opuntiae]|uniref:hypothetical protein n=1 Tax=Actinomadura sp. OS1-43 TaxID=604315 RepID=UPI00255AB7C8|nr:hypothetical protein [Actinomadura sp. OS1-43]MDL4821081.1 hypothetical protein [Actinomadura sp. OS1-43]